MASPRSYHAQGPTPRRSSLVTPPSARTLADLLQRLVEVGRGASALPPRREILVDALVLGLVLRCGRGRVVGQGQHQLEVAIELLQQLDGPLAAAVVALGVAGDLEQRVDRLAGELDRQRDVVGLRRAPALGSSGTITS